MATIVSVIARMRTLLVAADQFWSRDEEEEKKYVSTGCVIIPSPLYHDACKSVTALKMKLILKCVTRYSNIATSMFNPTNKRAIIDACGFDGYSAFVFDLIPRIDSPTLADELLAAAALECTDDASIDWLRSRQDLGTLANVKEEVRASKGYHQGNAMQSVFAEGESCLEREPGKMTIVRGHLAYPREAFQTRVDAAALTYADIEEEVFELPTLSKSDVLTKPVVRPGVEDKHSLIAPDLLKEVVTLGRRTGDVPRSNYNKARADANPAEMVGKGLFPCRSAIKIANVIRRFKIRNITSFLDLCSGPGGFSEFILTAFPHSIGLISTLADDDCDYAENSPLRKDPRVTIEQSVDKGDLRSKAVRHRLITESRRRGIDFACADGGFNCDGQDNQEQAHIILKMCELSTMILSLAEGGTAVMKTFGALTPTMATLIFMASTSFNRTSIVKLLSSRPSCHEQYVVFEGLKDNAAGKVIADTVDIIVEKGYEHVSISWDSASPHFSRFIEINNEMVAGVVASLRKIFETIDKKRSNLHDVYRTILEKEWGLEREVLKAKAAAAGLLPREAACSIASQPRVSDVPRNVTPELDQRMPNSAPSDVGDVGDERSIVGAVGALNISGQPEWRPAVFDGTLNLQATHYSAATVPGEISSWVSADGVVQIIRMETSDSGFNEVLWFLSAGASLSVRGSAELSVLVKERTPRLISWLKTFAPGFKPVDQAVGKPMTSAAAREVAMCTPWVSSLAYQMIELQRRDDFDLATMDRDEYKAYEPCISKMKSLALNSKIVVSNGTVVYPCGTAGPHVCTLSLFQTGTIGAQKEHPKRCSCHKTYDTQVLRKLCAELTHTKAKMNVGERTGAFAQRPVTNKNRRPAADDALRRAVEERKRR